MKKFLALLLVTCFVCLAAPVAFAQSNVTIAWTAREELDLAGYEVFQRLQDGVYDYDAPAATIQVGTETATLLEVPDGTYFWMLRAFDQAGNRGIDSAEVTASLDTVAPGQVQGVQITNIIKIEIQINP